MLAKEHLFAPGHTACAGCGQALAVRLVLRAAGSNVIVANATGCLEIFSSNYPYSSWEVPWIHSLFENTAAVASGIEAALKITGRLANTKVIAQGGDGGTADIGFGSLSGMLERGHDVLYVCYDNEGYMNTGVQRSGLTPYAASTTTSPAGKQSWGKPQRKKDMIALALAHGAQYVATASMGYPHDLDRKVKRALEITGPKYLQIHCPCPLGWRHDTSLTVEIAKLAVQTGLFPLLEFRDGELVQAHKISRPRPVEEYLRPQGRFAHLFASEAGREQIAVIQQIADRNIERYGLRRQDRTAAKGPATGEEKAPLERERVFTVAELAGFDGRKGQPAYVAYKGLVYDVSASSLWSNGDHQGMHQAGQDLTEAMADAGHGDEVLARFPVVGRLAQES